jgi:hypothetical protein
LHKSVLAIAALAVALPAHAEPLKSTAVQGLYKTGFKDCAAAMDRFVSLLHEDADYDYFSLFANERPNESAAATVTAEKYDDGQAIASITATKNASGKCDVTFTRTLAIPTQTCEQVRGALKEWKLVSQMGESDLYEDPTTPDGHLILAPIGKTGCLMVRHLMGWDA